MSEREQYLPIQPHPALSATIWKSMFPQTFVLLLSLVTKYIRSLKSISITPSCNMSLHDLRAKLAASRPAQQGTESLQ